MLDIIIPTYKNKEGLVRTLQSIPNYRELSITVIDDASNLDYSDLQNQFNFRLIELQKNAGPGIARQIGIMVTKEPYILFLDTGDTIIEGVLPEVIGIINIHPTINIFSWQYTNADASYSTTNNNLHGRIYKREFLEKYNITFSEQGSYANEDVGFNHICRLVLYQFYPEGAVFHLNKSIVSYDVTDMNSITRRENRAFIYKDQNMGLAYNAIHVYNSCKAVGVSDELLKDYISDIMGSQYFFFIRTLEERPEYLQIAWDGARYFYLNLFKKLLNKNSDLDISYRRMLNFYKNTSNTPPKLRFNAKLFMRLLEENEKVPPYYATLAENIDTIGGEPVE